MPLIEFWRAKTETILQMPIKQIVGLAGDGKILDGNETSDELRQFFSEISAADLKRFAQSCVDEPFEDSGFVLQDLVNEVCYRLCGEIKSGLYRGRKGQVGSDGLWTYGDWGFVVEIKTTAAYSIKLETIGNCRAVCRQDFWNH